LRQRYRHPIAAPNTPVLERIGEAICLPLDVPKSIASQGAVLRLVDQRDSRGIIGPSIADVRGNIVLPGYAPAECAGRLLVRLARFEPGGCDLYRFIPLAVSVSLR